MPPERNNSGGIFSIEIFPVFFIGQFVSPLSCIGKYRAIGRYTA